MRSRLAQIIPYFGSWPEWIELYFYSCGRNPMVDFIFFTDCPLPKHKYPNTIFHICTFDEYKAMVSEKLCIDYSIKSPYKITDLRPFFGFVHEQYLKDYDFWGFGDIDLVYGDLSMLVNDSNLSKYNLITTQNSHIAGHFTFCRNNRHYRNLCFKLDNWKEGIIEEEQHSYDERDWTLLVYPKIRYVRKFYQLFAKCLGLDSYKTFDFFNPILAPRCMFVEYLTSPNPAPGSKDGSRWSYNTKTGMVLREDDKKSLPYLHFLFFKKNLWLDTGCHWSEGYYQISDDIEKYEDIYIDYRSITAM